MAGGWRNGSRNWLGGNRREADSLRTTAHITKARRIAERFAGRLRRQNARFDFAARRKSRGHDFRKQKLGTLRSE
jgi:hypothetical protein